MAPYLIDRRLIVTVVFFFIVSILVCFVGGYVLGFQQGNKSTSSGSLVSKLFIPFAESNAAGIEPEIASSEEPGEDVDVDSPDVVVEVEQKTPTPVVEKKSTKANVKKSKKTVAVSTSESDVKEKIKIDLTSIIDTASVSDAKYSIQVGLYGIKINAERKVDKLIGLKLSGHLTNFINDKGDTLYNVRFGYFINKTSVIAALKTYQLKYTGEGYIIRLSQK